MPKRFFSSQGRAGASESLPRHDQSDFDSHSPARLLAGHSSAFRCRGPTGIDNALRNGGSKSKLKFGDRSCLQDSHLAPATRPDLKSRECCSASTSYHLRRLFSFLAQLTIRTLVYAGVLDAHATFFIFFLFYFFVCFALYAVRFS